MPMWVSNKRNVCPRRKTDPEESVGQFVGYPGQWPTYAVMKHQVENENEWIYRSYTIKLCACGRHRNL
jgi:hypothetical protein